MPPPILSHYGLNKIYRCAGYPVGFRVRTEKREKFYAGWPGMGLCLFFRSLPKRFTEASRFNEAQVPHYREILNTIPKDRKIVFYVIDCVVETGGVERRLALQFDWLMRHGIQPVLVIEDQGYPPLNGYPCLKLLQWAPNAREIFMNLVREVNPLAVEFHMKSPRLFHGLDLEALKKLTRVGVMIHGEGDFDQHRLNALDYGCSVRLYEQRYKSLTYLPNVVQFPDSIPTYNLKARKALYVGRIDAEKLPTVKSFVAICRRYGIDYDIAGSLSDAREVQAWIPTQPKHVFIGIIDTRQYLIDHSEDYAFIGGVGQVVLEAVASNLPCLVTTHQKDAMRSAFVTKDNLAELLNWNCVLRGCPEDRVGRHIESFFESRSKAIKGNEVALTYFYGTYFARKELQALRHEDEVWAKYLKLVLGE